MKQQLMTICELSTALGVSTTTANKWRKRGMPGFVQRPTKKGSERTLYTAEMTREWVRTQEWIRKEL